MKQDKRKRINQGEGCYACNQLYGESNPYDVQVHEIFYGSDNREKSIEDGLCVELCTRHHDTNYQSSVHNDRHFDFTMKQVGQIEYEKTHTRDEFIKRYGMNYLDITYEEYLRGR